MKIKYLKKKTTSNSSKDRYIKIITDMTSNIIRRSTFPQIWSSGDKPSAFISITYLTLRLFYDYQHAVR